MTFILMDIPKAARNAGAPQGKNPMIAIWNWNDVKTHPARDSKGIKYAGDFVWLAGKYAAKIYATSSSIALPGNGQGEEDQVGFSALPEFNHPGNGLEIMEFIQNMTNQPLGVAVQSGSCDGGESFWTVYGTPCNPLSLVAEIQDNNEAAKSMMKFQQFRPATVLPGRYYGNITCATANVVPVDAVNIDVSAGSGEYQLQDNAGPTALTGLSNVAHGGVYTLIGSGGANPATLAAGDPFFLLQGNDWQGLAGSRLTLKAFENGDGTFVFFEQSRS